MDLRAPVHRQWFRTGDEAFEGILSCIDAATRSIKFEIYIFNAGPPGDGILAALVRARERSVQVRVLVDAFGSLYLSDSFWDSFRAAGGEMRWFNPLSLDRFHFRDHRKIMICDEELAYIGGYNVSREYLGDGVNRGWRDLGLKLRGPLVAQLSASFDEMFELADFRHKRFTRLRRPVLRRQVLSDQGQLLLSGPGRGRNVIRRALREDFARAGVVRIISAYFLPPVRLRRALTRVARRGGSVRLILPGKSDVPLLLAATRSLYGRLMRAGVEIFEYQPQILHTKFITVDQHVYAGSANFDPRSLGINYDFLVRLTGPEVAAEARQIFDEHQAHSAAVERKAWRQSRTFWTKLRERLAWLIFMRIDPYLTRRQLRNFR